MDNTQSTPYFPVFKSLHRGGLSLWLNRKALLPLAIIPVIVTFLTLFVMRHYTPDDLSPFMIALLQIPADFVTGLFCALIILIIMKAPKKADDAKPVMFSINVVEKKQILIAGAAAHVIFGYLYLGGFAVTDMVAEPLRAAAQNEQAIRFDLMLLMICMLVAGLYAIRFTLLPILIINETDMSAFYRRFSAFGFSVPVLFTKIISTMVVGTLLILPFVSLAPPTEGTETLPLSQTLPLDIASSIASVLAHIWAYASLAIGIRSMLEKTS